MLKTCAKTLPAACATEASRRQFLRRFGAAALAPTLATALGPLSGCASVPPVPSQKGAGRSQGAAGQADAEVDETNLLDLADGAVPLVPAALEGRVAGQSEQVLQAFALVGIPYRWGGNTPEGGFDCSGLVRWVMRQTLGIELPRSTAEIAQVGDIIQLEDRLPGDLIFFNTRRHRFSHMGIYVGQNEFVHAPSRGGRVRLDRIDHKYWRVRITGVRRLT